MKDSLNNLDCEKFSTPKPISYRAITYSNYRNKEGFETFDRNKKELPIAEVQKVKAAETTEDSDVITIRHSFTLNDLFAYHNNKKIIISKLEEDNCMNGSEELDYSEESDEDAMCNYDDEDEDEVISIYENDEDVSPEWLNELLDSMNNAPEPSAAPLPGQTLRELIYGENYVFPEEERIVIQDPREQEGETGDTSFIVAFILAGIIDLVVKEQS